MPLQHSGSVDALERNMVELMKGKAGKSRQKGINTLAKRRGVSPGKARAIMAYAISKDIQRKS